MNFFRLPFLVTLLLLSTSIAVRSDPPYPDPERYRETINAFITQDRDTPLASNAIVATGSSSMRGWHSRIGQDLQPLSIIARGFGGSNMYDALYFLDELVLRHKPRAVILYQGDNDAALGASTEQVMAHFAAIVDTLHTELPATRMYILAVKPSIDRWSIWPAMKEINEQLKRYAGNDPLITYIDVATTMLGADGKPLPSIFLGDLLHMNDAGYDLWTAAVRPVLLPRERDFEPASQRRRNDDQMK